MADYYQLKNQNIFNPPANTDMGNANSQFNTMYVQNALVLGNVSVTGTTIIAPRVSSIAYPGNDTAADTAGGQTITLNGTGFVAGASVLINGSAVGVVSVVSSTVITFTSPANSTGSYVVYVVNPDGSTAIAIPGIQYSGTPTWTTAAGTLGNVYETASFNQTVTATGDAPITYSVFSGSLPPGSTFNSNGTITGTSQLSSSPTTYSFTVRATDAEQQDTNRAFSISVIPDVVTWSSPANNATYTPAANVAIANITLSATSAVGSGITYTANTLPTGLSLTGANISGTPTVVANTSSLLTATANTTSELSSITINWVVSVASDPYFMYNSLLLPGNGSNGAQNNTFLDGSTNNFTITRNGNTTQGTFSPYGANWSNYFNGSSYLTAGTTASNFLCTGSATGITATLEAWVNPTAYTTGASMWMFSSVHSKGATYFNFGVASGKVRFYWFDGGYKNVESTSTSDVPLNTWTHIAVTISGSTIKIYVNGVLNTTSATYTGVAAAGLNQNDNIGVEGAQPTYFTGYISNYRLTNTVVYSSSFTSSTTPLTAISGTRLLTCQSNRFIDNSTNAFAITLGGTPTIQRFSPFSPGATYSAGTIGGSGYFDGNDYLTIPSNSAFAFGTGDFTIECWIYLTGSNVNYRTIVSTRASNGTATGWCLATNASGDIYIYANAFIVTASSAIVPNVWYHVAVCRVSGTTTLYLNGVSKATSATSRTYSDSTVAISNEYYLSGEYWQGYISDVRLIKGTAVYTGNFTPPTAPLTAITNTSLLTNYTNAGIIDNTMLNNLETVGNAQISTAQSKFGGGSMSFDGTGDYLTSPNSLLAIQGSSAFTLEAWIYPTSVTGDLCIYDTRGGSGFVFFINSSGKLQVYDSVATLQTQSTVTLTTNSWTFISLVRVAGSTTVTYYVNGTAAGTFTLASFATATQTRIGARNDGAAAYVGYIDDLRITLGYARYTANFTSPTSAFPTY